MLESSDLGMINAVQDLPQLITTLPQYQGARHALEEALNLEGPIDETYNQIQAEHSPLRAILQDRLDQMLTRYYDLISMFHSGIYCARNLVGNSSSFS
jgi:hypothetical protein